MSGIAMKWARKQTIGSSSLKSLVNAIAARADDNGNTWVSQATLAGDIGVSDRRVRSMLAELQSLGVITRCRRSAGRLGRQTDLIRIDLNSSFEITAADRRTAKQSCNRNYSALPTGPRVPGNTKGTTLPYQEGASTKVEGCSTTSAPANGRDPAGPTNVVAFRPKRGLAA